MIKSFNEYINERYEPRFIFGAAKNGDLDFIKRYNGNLNLKDDDGWTMLIYASYYGNIDIVRYLIEKGADMDRKTDAGSTALMYASMNGHFDIVKYLIEQGADLNIKSNLGWTAYGRNEKYFNSYEFQKWFMDVIGNYEKLNQFVQGNIHSDIKIEYADDIYKMDLGL